MQSQITCNPEKACNGNCPKCQAQPEHNEAIIEWVMQRNTALPPQK